MSGEQRISDIASRWHHFREGPIADVAIHHWRPIVPSTRCTAARVHEPSITAVFGQQARRKSERSDFFGAGTMIAIDLNQ
jgi:hypothetical protein